MAEPLKELQQLLSRLLSRIEGLEGKSSALERERIVAETLFSHFENEERFAKARQNVIQLRHDLSQPLGTILLNAEYLLEGQLSGRAREQLVVIRESTLEAKSVMDDAVDPDGIEPEAP